MTCFRCTLKPYPNCQTATILMLMSELTFWVCLFAGNTSCKKITGYIQQESTSIPPTQSVHSTKTKETKPSRIGAIPKENTTGARVSNQQLNANSHVDLTPSWVGNESKGTKGSLAQQPTTAAKNKPVQPSVFSQSLDSNKRVDMTPMWAVNAPTATNKGNISTQQQSGSKPSLAKLSSQLLDSSKHVDMTPSWALNESTGAIPKTRFQVVERLPPR